MLSRYMVFSLICTRSIETRSVIRTMKVNYKTSYIYLIKQLSLHKPKDLPNRSPHGIDYCRFYNIYGRFNKSSKSVYSHIPAGQTTPPPKIIKNRLNFAHKHICEKFDFLRISLKLLLFSRLSNKEQIII